MKHLLLLAAGFVALSACNKSPTVDAKNATPEEVAKQVRASGVETAFVTPGEWTSKVTIVSMHVPGAPAAMSDQMKGRVSEERKYCLTPEQAKKPNENFFAGNQNECRYDHFTMGGGKIDIAMVCKQENLSNTTNMAGTYTPTTYSMDVSSVGSGPQQDMTMKMHVDAKRIGECTGKED